MQAYCVKCRVKRDMKDPKQMTMKNGRPATQGKCPVCSTKMFRMGKSEVIIRVYFKEAVVLNFSWSQIAQVLCRIYTVLKSVHR